MISQFSMAAISFVFVCKELKISKIVQINQFFQVLNLICTYDNAFYGLITPMLMRKKMKTMMSAKIRLEETISKKSRFQSEAKCEAIDM